MLYPWAIPLGLVCLWICNSECVTGTLRTQWMNTRTDSKIPKTSVWDVTSSISSYIASEKSLSLSKPQIDHFGCPEKSLNPAESCWAVMPTQMINSDIKYNEVHVSWPTLWSHTQKIFLSKKKSKIFWRRHSEATLILNVVFLKHEKTCKRFKSNCYMSTATLQKSARRIFHLWVES